MKKRMKMEAGVARVTLATLLLLPVASACGGKVDRQVFDREVSEIRAELSRHDSTLEAHEDRMRALREDVEELGQDLGDVRADLSDFRARIQELENGLRFAVPVHFEFDRAAIRPADRAVLDRYAAVVEKHYRGATITVEGFADPAGSAAYNLELSRRRARAVASYLTNQGGLDRDRLRTVGYGEDRLVKPGAAGPGREGLENRRVTFVVEYGGDAGSLAPQTSTASDPSPGTSGASLPAPDADATGADREGTEESSGAGESSADPTPGPASRPR